MSLVALSAPGCGDDDDGGSGGSSGGGTGGGGTGGGGTGGGGTGGGDAGLTCGTETCTGWKIGGLIPMNACCTTDDKCGGDVTTSLANLLGNFPVGCYDQNQPGKVDCGCPSYPFISPVDNKPTQFDGCCSTSGECGFLVDISSKAGPNFGCIPLTKLGQTKVPCTVGSETPPPKDADGGDDFCPLPSDGGTDSGTGGTDGGSDAATD